MIITNKERKDGFGAQYQTIIFTILFCELEGYDFVYRPFNEIEHNYDSDPFFIEKKETLINIKNNFPLFNPDSKNFIKDIDLNFIYKKVEDNLDKCLSLKSFQKIKDLFYLDKFRNENESYAAIHVRRPNKYDIGDYGYTPDDYFLKIIETIRNNHPNIKKIKIFSQGKKELFNKFVGNDIELYLDDSIENTFTEMVFSDILVTSKSSFSYCAGLLSNGIVYYTPFWHKPKKTWIKI